MNKKPFQIENLDVFQPLVSNETTAVAGGLTLAPEYPPSDEPKRDDSLPRPSGRFYPLPLPCHPYKPSPSPTRIPYPCGCSPYLRRKGLPWCAVIL